MLATLPLIPDQRNLQSYSLRAENHGNIKHHIIVFQYPDCTREYDGKNWKITVDKRRDPTVNNIFFNSNNASNFK